jgi:group I intron endonuclease
MPCIYKITSPTNKIYIGQSWDLKKRIYQYIKIKCKGQPKLYASLKKYGWDNHILQVITELPNDISQKVLDSYEILYWEFYKDCGIEMLNVREPGTSGRLSEESKRLIGLKNKGKAPMLGKKHSKETRERMSISITANSGRRGKKLTDKHKKAISEWSKKPRPNMKGRAPWNKGLSGICSAETIEKMSKTKLGKSPWNKGLKGAYSQETIDKMKKPKSESAKENMRKPKNKKNL